MKDEYPTESLMKNGDFWFPEAISTYASKSDDSFYFVLLLSVLFFFAIIGISAYFVFKYRRKSDNQLAEEQITHNTTAEVAWTVIPTILVMIVFAWGFKDYMNYAVPPTDAYEIRVQAKKWDWLFEYGNDGVKSIELVVPKGTNVKLVMSSIDVLHSFYVPNLRIKRDVIPNRYTAVWFNAEKEGEFQVFCTEYCGLQHSTMLATLKVVSREDFKKWLDKKRRENDNRSPIELGRELYTQQCKVCHSIDGSAGLIGPSWKGLYKAKRTFTDGTEGIADENYLRESIVNPSAKIVTGYSPQMAAFSGILSDEDINAIIEYIKILK